MMISDKRQHRRVDCEIPCSFRNMDDSGRMVLAETYVKNISEGGIRFRSDRFIPVHHRLFFHLNIPLQKPIAIKTKPAWITEVPSSGQYEVGASFIDLSEDDRTAIRHLVKTSLAARAY